jgi:uncharacterized MAPEG superfamily protein
MRYVVSLMRMHPCTRLVAVMPDSTDQAVDALVAADPGSADPAQARQYVLQAQANLREAGARFPNRVVVTSAAGARSAATELLAQL